MRHLFPTLVIAWLVFVPMPVLGAEEQATHKEVEGLCKTEETKIRSLSTFCMNGEGNLLVFLASRERVLDRPVDLQVEASPALDLLDRARPAARPRAPVPRRRRMALRAASARVGTRPGKRPSLR